MPLGSSPIRPEGWDPTGLKYRKVTTDHGSAVESNGRRGEERREKERVEESKREGETGEGGGLETDEEEEGGRGGG